MKLLTHYLRTGLCCACLLLAGAGKLRAADSSASVPGVCQPDGTNTCSDTPKPQWELEKERADQAWDACEKDVAKFCEGIQTGDHRVEDCLNAHAVELSTGCLAARPHP